MPSRSMCLLGSTLLVASTVSANPVRLAFWVEGPVNSGCHGWGMPYPGYSVAAKSVPSCWNNTLSLIKQHAELIDEVQLNVGFIVTNVSNGLIDLDRDGSSWAPGFREKPLEWLPHYIPALRTILTPDTKIMVSLFFGGGKFGNATAVAGQTYANADDLASQLVQLATTYSWIDGYTLDYEAYCDDVRQEAARLARLFGTLSAALHAAGKQLHFCTNQNGAGFEQFPYFQSYLDAGVDRLLEMGTYCNHTKTGGTSDREEVTRQLLKFPLDNTAFGLGDYRPLDTKDEADAWLNELLEYSAGMAGQLTVHVYDLFGAQPATPAPDCEANRTEFDRHCVRPPESWWPVLARFHAVRYYKPYSR